MLLGLTIIENEPLMPLEILDNNELLELNLLDNNNLLSMSIEDNTEEIEIEMLEMDTIEELMVKPIFDVSYARRHPWLNT